MVSQLIEHVRKVTVFKVPKITEEKKRIYIEMLVQLCRYYERIDGAFFNQFNDLPKIVITTDKKDIPCPDALGCMTLKGVYSLFFDNWRYESAVISMEFAHWLMRDLAGNHMPSINDVIHVMANYGKPPHVLIKQMPVYPTAEQAKARKISRKTVLFTIPLVLYNVKIIRDEWKRIMADVRAGRAPAGKNPYFRFNTAKRPDEIASKYFPEELLEHLAHDHAGHHH